MSQPCQDGSETPREGRAAQPLAASARKLTTAARGATSAPVPRPELQAARPCRLPLSTCPLLQTFLEHVGRPHPHGARTMRAAGQLGVALVVVDRAAGPGGAAHVRLVVRLCGRMERGGPCWAAGPARGLVRKTSSASEGHQGLNRAQPTPQSLHRTCVHTLPIPGGGLNSGRSPISLLLNQVTCYSPDCSPRGRV